ncbi:MAG: hypothetical protein E5X43_16530, partial [Mesorhizobium sp.]
MPNHWPVGEWDFQGFRAGGPNPNGFRSDPSHPPLACRPSPPQGGRLSARLLSPIIIVARVRVASELPISPLAGEMAGRPEGGVLSLRDKQVLPAPAAAGSVERTGRGCQEWR